MEVLLCGMWRVMCSGDLTWFLSSTILTSARAEGGSTAEAEQGACGQSTEAPTKSGAQTVYRWPSGRAVGAWQC